MGSTDALADAAFVVGTAKACLMGAACRGWIGYAGVPKPGEDENCGFSIAGVAPALNKGGGSLGVAIGSSIFHILVRPLYLQHHSTVRSVTSAPSRSGTINLRVKTRRGEHIRYDAHVLLFARTEHRQLDIHSSYNTRHDFLLYQSSAPPVSHCTLNITSVATQNGYLRHHRDPGGC